MWPALRRSRPPIRYAALGELPSGYAQLLGTTAYAPGLRASYDPAVGAFIRGTDLPPGAIGDGHHVQYIPAYAPSGIVGGGLFGGGAIGHRVPYHGMLIPVQVGIYTVYEPAPGGDPRK